MKDLFTSLISRHLGTCDTVQPRTLGRFEVDRGRGVVTSANGDINPFFSGVDVPKDGNHQPNLIGPRENTPHQPYLIGQKENTPHQWVAEPSTQPRLTEQQEVLTDAHTLPNSPHEINQFNERVHDTFSPDSLTTEHNFGNKLNQRINDVLQRLVGDSKSHTTESVQDEQINLHYGSQVASPSEIKIALQNTAATHQTNRQKNTGDGREAAPYDSLASPSWLPDIEARFASQLKNKEAKTEPVINVTIGRVEVRAVQNEAPIKEQRTKKHTGAMPLDEYLKKRKGGGRA